jgi:hypothetical protein
MAQRLRRSPDVVCFVKKNAHCAFFFHKTYYISCAAKPRDRPARESEAFNIDAFSDKQANKTRREKGYIHGE